MRNTRKSGQILRSKKRSHPTLRSGRGSRTNSNTSHQIPARVIEADSPSVVAYGGADMPLTGPIPEGETFFCPHCGALYSVTYSRPSKGHVTIAKCVVCRQTMDKRDSTDVPIYKLVQRPEDA